MIEKRCKHNNHEGDVIIPIEQFGKLKSSLDGYHCYCKICNTRDARAYAIKNKDKVKKSKQKYYTNNKDKYVPPTAGEERKIYLEKKRQYYINNQDKIKKYRHEYNERNITKIQEYSKVYYQLNHGKIKEYRENNPDKHRGYKETYTETRARNRIKRRMREKQSIPVWYNIERSLVVELYNLSSSMSDNDNQFHVDHIIPLSHTKVCGLHCIANLQIIPAKENLEKHNTFILDDYIHEVPDQ